MEREYVAYFLENLDLALHDQALEAEGESPEYYWDTSDVRNALLGQAAYYDVDDTSGERIRKFNRGKFEDDRALVHCLEAAGWFGTIKMLQPHQAELYKLVSREFDIGSVGPPEGGATQFVKDVAVQGLEQTDFAELAELQSEEIAALVRKQAGSATTLFKVVQCVRPYGWKTRLARWVQTKRIEIDSDPYDYRSLVSTKTFERLLAEFDVERPKFGANNFTDAIGLCQLAQRIKDYQTGQTRTVPRFFSRRLDLRILERTQLADQFTYTHGTGRYTVFRDIEYYKLRATLNPKYGPAADAEKRSVRSLTETRMRLAEIRRAQEPLTAELLSTIKIGDRPLSDVLRGIREYWFLEQVWLPFAAHTEVMDAIKEYVEPARDLGRSPTFRDEIEAQVGQTLAELNDKSSQYQKISHFWTELERAATRVLPPNLGDLNLFKTSGLLRFGFPDESRRGIGDLLTGLVHPGAGSRNQVLLELFRRCQDTTDNSPENLAVAGGVMWALRMDKEIIELLSMDGAVEHYSLKILTAAACFRKRIDLLKGWELTQQLESNYHRSSNSNEKSDLAVGLGYLYFHYWQSMTSDAVHLDERSRREVLEKAVRHAQEAASMEATGPEKRVYAINQHLYYLLHGPDIFSSAEVNAAAESLLAFDGNDAVWQYRYDDTLGYYFERRAEQADSGQRQRWFDLAMRRLDKAWEGANGDEEVARHRERLMVKSSM
jgi:hypothetical protein